MKKYQKNHFYFDMLIKRNKNINYHVEWEDKQYKKRKYLKQDRRKYGFDGRETWNMDISFFIWLYEHLCMYKDKASKIVDLSYHTFEYKGKTLTQLECINSMIEGCELYFENRNTTDKEKQDRIQSVCELWSLVVFQMWW